MLTSGDIENGLEVSFEGIQSNVEHIYVLAYVDINENNSIDAGDLAVFYNGVSVEEVEENAASPSDIGEKNSIDLPLNEIYALDELAIDIEGHIYKTVVIGDQEWFAENLKTTKFRNGENIPTGHNSEEWSALMNAEDGTGNPAYAMNPEALSEDGLLYNWFAVTDSRGLAPEGWRVPTDNDYKKLMKYAGMPDEELDAYTWAGEDAGVGTKLKSKDRGMNGTDDYGFNGIPSGMRSTKGTFSRYDDDFFFWCSTEDYREDVDDRYLNGIRRALRNSEASVIRQGSSKLGGYAVRCVRDIE